MKPITPSEAVAVLPAEKSVCDAALLRFEDLISTQFWSQGDCKRMIDEGWIQTATVCVSEVPAYLLGYHFTDDGGLWIDIAQSLPGGTGDGRHLNQAIDMIAMKERRRYVRFYTARHGLVEFQRANGYEVEAVLLTKKI